MHFFFCLIMALLACSSARAGEQIWHEFDVGISDELGFGNERVALLLRAKVNGRNCHVQLDTGASTDVLWHSIVEAGAAPRPVTVTLQIGDMRVDVLADAANLAPLEQAGCGGVLATVGNALFDHGTLMLDLGHERFAFVPGTQLSAHAGAQTMQYLRSGPRGGHPLVDITLDNGRRGQVLLDTGAARFGLAATNRAQWDDLSGGLPLEASPAVRVFHATNAKDADASACYETLVERKMTIGGQSLPQTMVSYCRGKEFQLSRPLLGVLGMLPLARRRIVIDYIAQRWLLENPIPFR
jgi:hypothetical protein